MRWNPRRLLPGPDSSARFAERGVGLSDCLARARHPAAWAVRTTGFWIAVLLPVLYVPLLLTGLSTGREAAALVGLTVLHLVALAAGHTHNRH